MSGRSGVRRLLLTLVVVGLVGFFGPATSGATFTDAHDGTGSVTAADDFGSSPSQFAYDDANQNGQHDWGETTYNESELLSFNDQTVHLVIPSAMSPVDSGSSIQMSAATIRSDADVTSNSGVSLSAASGDLELSGITVRGKQAVSLDASGNVTLESGTLESEQNNVDVQASGNVSFAGSTVTASKGQIQVGSAGLLDLSGATVEAPKNGFQLTAERIAASGASFYSKSGDMVLSATTDGGGQVDLRNALFDGQKGKIDIRSNGDVDLTGGTIRAKQGQATADLGTASATLFVDGATLDDRDGTLVYDPDGITVQGTPSSGTTSP